MFAWSHRGNGRPGGRCPGAGPSPQGQRAGTKGGGQARRSHNFVPVVGEAKFAFNSAGADQSRAGGGAPVSGAHQVGAHENRPVGRSYIAVIAVGLRAAQVRFL
jgi:hypothetical protein